MYNRYSNNKNEKPHITLLECDGLADKPYKIRYYQGDTGIIGVVEKPKEKVRSRIIIINDDWDKIRR